MTTLLDFRLTSPFQWVPGAPKFGGQRLWRVSGATENSEDDEIAGLTELVGGEARKTLGGNQSQARR